MIPIATRIDIERRLTFRRELLEKLYAAYDALANSGVQQYSIGSRSLTRLDLAKLMEEIRKTESEIDELEAVLSGGGRRKAAGAVPIWRAGKRKTDTPCRDRRYAPAALPYPCAGL